MYNINIKFEVSNLKIWNQCLKYDLNKKYPFFGPESMYQKKFQKAEREAKAARFYNFKEENT